MRSFIATVLLSFFSLNGHAMAKNPDFYYYVETSASRQTIWSLWTDVSQWTTFDEALEYATLDANQTFEVGATGALKAYGAPKTKFEITQYDAPHSLTVTLKLPLYQAIDLKRSFDNSAPDRTVFKHTVTFKGVLSGIYQAFLGRRFTKDLKAVMNKIKEIAESK